MKVTKITRPWGSEDLFIQNQAATVKLLYVNKGEQLSLQYHMKRAEFWKVISGNPEIVLGDKTIRAFPGDEIHVEKEMHHRISAPNDDVVILEIGTGEFDENDIVRLEDKYHRQ